MRPQVTLTWHEVVELPNGDGAVIDYRDARDGFTTLAFIDGYDWLLRAADHADVYVLSASAEGWLALDAAVVLPKLREFVQAVCDRRSMSLERGRFRMILNA